MLPEKFVSPFRFDPFAVVMMAFRRLYPGKECECWIDQGEIKGEDGETVYGITEQYEDGELSVRVSASLSISDAVEVFAHELAHVAVGMDAQHGPEFEEANDRIFEEYNRILEELGEEDMDVPLSQ